MILLNNSKVRMPKKYLTQAIVFFNQFLKKQKVANTIDELVVVFLDASAAKKLNKQFRGKDYATNVLSFDSDELVLCPQVVQKQALENELSFRDQTVYLLFHGILHLLGYDHEDSNVKADEMFDLQDKAFEQWMLTTKNP